MVIKQFLASFVGGGDLFAYGVACLVRHRRFGNEDNFWEMVARPRLIEHPFEDSLANYLVTKWFHSTLDLATMSLI
jgi:hypothetical protein